VGEGDPNEDEITGKQARDGKFNISSTQGPEKETSKKKRLFLTKKEGGKKI